MFFAYVLRSDKTGTHYYGHSEDVGLRLEKHNAGKVRYTRNKGPWKLLYKESFETRLEARRRELFFKSIEGYKYLKQINVI